ncbi:MAG: prolipoprotein diacylglyceryl transferase [Oscillospiraceae bacterium]|nr:prolipoprotein diacylglyceryl transferase [Oscillospiraceae bacterium]
MNPIAVYTGEITLYWSGIVITLGIAAGLALTLTLYPTDYRHNTAVWVMFPLALLFSVVFARAIHWYCHIEYYESFRSALTDFSTGSFCIPGVLLGTWLAALLVRLMHLTDNTGKLLDAAAPGMALILAIVRLSALFNASCRGKIVIEKAAFQRLPFAAALTDSAGNVGYRFATFFVEFLLLLVVMIILLIFFLNHRNDKLRGTRSRGGEVARWFLVLYGVVEVIMDSTRYDSHLMHFTLIKKLNPYACFISVGQVFAAITILCVLIHYLKLSVRSRGWRWYHIVLLLVYVGTLLGAGYWGEYMVQRTGLYVRCYTIQGISLLVMVLVVLILYRTCLARRRRA